MITPDVTPARWDIRSERFSRLTVGLAAGLLIIQGAVVVDRLQEEAEPADPAREQTVTVRIESEAVLAHIETVPEQQVSAVVPPSSGILPPEMSQPLCRDSPIAWLPETVRRWHPYVAEAAEQFSLPPAILDILMTFESLGHPSVRSSVGAVGLIQIMPATGESLAQQLQLPPLDLADPASNVYLSASYIRNYINTGEVDTSAGFTAETARQIAIVYNGGPGRLRSYHQTGMASLPAETVFYSNHVALAWDEQALPASNALNDYLSYSGARRLAQEAATLGTPPC